MERTSDEFLSLRKQLEDPEILEELDFELNETLKKTKFSKVLKGYKLDSRLQLHALLEGIETTLTQTAAISTGCFCERADGTTYWSRDCSCNKT